MLDAFGMPTDGANLEPIKMVAIYPHPQHGRLVEQPFLVLSRFRYMDGFWFVMTWKDHDYVYYERCNEKGRK